MNWHIMAYIDNIGNIVSYNPWKFQSSIFLLIFARKENVIENQSFFGIFQRFLLPFSSQNYANFCR